MSNFASSFVDFKIPNWFDSKHLSGMLRGIEKEGVERGQVIARAEEGVRRRQTMQMRACETGVVVQGCVSRTADARQSQSAGPADTLHPGFVAFARAASFSMGEAAFE